MDIWRTLRGRYGRNAAEDQGFLFGHFTIADAMYMPVATRFRTYGIDLAELGDDGSAGTYMDRLLALPAFLEWEEGARLETAARA